MITSLLAINPSDFSAAGIAIFGIVLVVFLFAMVWASRYTKVGPNEVLIVSGRRHRLTDGTGQAFSRGFRIVKGGGTFIVPVVEKSDVLSLELLTIDVQTPEVYTSKAFRSGGWCRANQSQRRRRFDCDRGGTVLSASAPRTSRASPCKPLEGHLRAILGTMTVEDIYQNRDAFASKVQEVAAGDMANMGLGIVSFTIRDIRDSQGYLEALGKPRIRPGQTRRADRAIRSRPRCDDQKRSGAASRAGSKVRRRFKIAEAQRDYQRTSRNTLPR
jgi:flotillin